MTSETRLALLNRYISKQSDSYFLFIIIVMKLHVQCNKENNRTMLKNFFFAYFFFQLLDKLRP
jgi:hypothetical protein